MFRDFESFAIDPTASRTPLVMRSMAWNASSPNKKDLFACEGGTERTCSNGR